MWGEGWKRAETRFHCATSPLLLERLPPTPLTLLVERSLISQMDPDQYASYRNSFLPTSLCTEKVDFPFFSSFSRLSIYIYIYKYVQASGRTFFSLSPYEKKCLFKIYLQKTKKRKEKIKSRFTKKKNCQFSCFFYFLFISVWIFKKYF